MEHYTILWRVRNGSQSHIESKAVCLELNPIMNPHLCQYNEQNAATCLQFKYTFYIFFYYDTVLDFIPKAPRKLLLPFEYHIHLSYHFLAVK